MTTTTEEFRAHVIELLTAPYEGLPSAYSAEPDPAFVDADITGYEENYAGAIAFDQDVPNTVVVQSFRSDPRTEDDGLPVWSASFTDAPDALLLAAATLAIRPRPFIAIDTYRS